VNGGVTDDGTISDLPWAAVFDPVANARALSAIQARGFLRATQLVDRFVHIAATSTNAAGPQTATGTKGHPSGEAAGTDVDLILTAWWSLFGRLLRSMPGAAALRGESATFDLGNESASGSVHLNADGRGRIFHNSPMGKRMSDRKGDCPIAEERSDRLVRLPFYNSLGEVDQNNVIRAIQEFDV
jgi:hypothetical protein